MRVGRWVVVVLSMLALVLELVGWDDPASAAAAVVVAVLIAAPLVRVAWFARRWAARGDKRYAAVATGVLVLPVLALGISLLTN